MLITPKEAALRTPRDASGRAHIVGLSGGKDSTALASRLQQVQPDTPFTFFCTPTGDELPSMTAHWARLESRFSPAPFFHLQAKDRKTGGFVSLNSLIKGFGSLPNWRQRWCTRILKIQPAEAYMRILQLNGPVTMYVGLRADEATRQGLYAEDLDVQFPLRDWKWGLDEVLGHLAEQELIIPARTDCGRCLYQRLVEWKILSEEHPDIYEDAIKQEDSTGHTFRSPGRDTWAADLRTLRKEFRSGRKVRGEDKFREAREAGACRVCSL